MSMLGDHKRNLRSILFSYWHEGNPVPEIIVETYYMALSTNEWDSDAIIDVLEHSKGISDDIDDILDRNIINEKKRYGMF